MEADRTSPREREVLQLLGEQLTHEEIGRRLFISTRTVESHVAALRRKLSMPDHRSLVRYAVSEQSRSVDLTSLPVTPLTSFIGRVAEIGELTATLEASRLVTAVGPGGVGKTRLAATAAKTLESTFTGGVRWVDLTLVSDPADLDAAVARLCRVEVTSDRSPVQVLVAAFRQQRLLLVLDNSEHLVNAVAVLAEHLLTQCPGLTILVTSRSRLALPFERVFRVPGLSSNPDGDAVALFVERAAAAGSSQPSQAERIRIAAVCAALGGLALAVELAAVRVPALGLDGVEKGLLDHASLLTGGPRLTARHRSMHDTLNWSVTLLDPPAAIALRRLGVLVAPFSSAAAESVAGFEPLSVVDVRAGLTQLTEHNLLITSEAYGHVRYRMLEPIRQYGLAQMDFNDRPAYSRHLAWCQRAVHEARGALEAEPLGIADDVRAALAWAAGQQESYPAAHMLAGDFGMLLFSEGRLREAQQRLEQAAAFTSEGRAAARNLARAAAVAKCRILGDEALRLELAAANQAEEAGDQVGHALALGRSAELLNRFPGMFAGSDLPSAHDLIREANQIAPDNPLVAATLTVASAGYAATSGSPTRASAQTALTAARAASDVLLESSALDALIAAAIFESDIVGAHQLAQERVARLTSWSDEPAAGLEIKDALHVAVFCAIGAGNLATARHMAVRQHQLPFLRERRDLADEELAAPAALSGEWQDALAAGERFLQAWTAAGRPRAPGRGLAPASIALVLGLLEDHQARAGWLAVLAEIRGVTVAHAHLGTGYGELFEAMVLLHQGFPDAAYDVLTRQTRDGLYPFVFSQWSAATLAEAAVLAHAPDNDSLLLRAQTSSRGNPIATAITARASALKTGDKSTLQMLADYLAPHSSYQATRTRTLATGAP